jgi:hypothetical protein
MNDLGRQSTEKHHCRATTCKSVDVRDELPERVVDVGARAVGFAESVSSFGVSVLAASDALGTMGCDRFESALGAGVATEEKRWEAFAAENRRRLRRSRAAEAMTRVRLSAEAQRLLEAADELPCWASPALDATARGPQALRRMQRWLLRGVKDCPDRDAVLAFLRDALDAYARLGASDRRRLRQFVAWRLISMTPLSRGRGVDRLECAPPEPRVCAEPGAAHAPPRALPPSSGLLAA